jgi:hypothetical protein
MLLFPYLQPHFSCQRPFNPCIKISQTCNRTICELLLSSNSLYSHCRTIEISFLKYLNMFLTFFKLATWNEVRLFWTIALVFYTIHIVKKTKLLHTLQLTCKISSLQDRALLLFSLERQKTVQCTKWKPIWHFSISWCKGLTTRSQNIVKVFCVLVLSYLRKSSRCSKQQFSQMSVLYILWRRQHGFQIANNLAEQTFAEFSHSFSQKIKQLTK